MNRIAPFAAALRAALILCCWLSVLLPATAQQLPNPLLAVKAPLRKKILAGQNAEAVKELTQLLAADSLNPDYLYLRAECRALLSEYTPALADYDKAARIVPGSPLVLASRAVALVQVQRYPEAVADFDQALLKVPNQPLMRLYSGWARMYTNDLPGALRDLDLAVQLDGSNKDAWLYRGIVQMIAGRYPDAQFSISEYVRRNPKLPLGYANRALIYLATGEQAKAAEDAARAFKIAPTDKEVVLIQAFVAEKADAAQGQAQYEAILAKTTDKADFYLQRGDLHMQTGNIARAIPDWQQAADLGNKEAAFRLKAGYKSPQ
ncbi:tetratricopeptide repeat protein [Hymenobacter sp. CRA2]|uniref:tetratricopeptide repeat protein n=1 Tax=Hymenobacter sp. CRA2 TaxID=1955620 RepID=UPI00098FEB21|nr:tetratricopeptide repeat protein [Hymenobacter sp. CRA2]OON70196.1 hypothetical protein B0919_05535 [Hymenobacter sp. CRA2]